MHRGDDTTGDGSFARPWLTVDHATRYADRGATAGSTVYVHDVNSGNDQTVRAIFWRRTAATSTLDAQFTVVAYPGFQPKATGQMGVEAYTTDAMVVSKLDVYASNRTSVDANDQPAGPVISAVPGNSFGIKTSKDGRVVANRITDIPGGCVDGMAGAITGSGYLASNVKIYGRQRPSTPAIGPVQAR